MEIRKAVYIRFYTIFQKIYMDREFPVNDTWQKTCRNRTSEKHWEQVGLNTKRPLACLLSGREWRYFSRFKFDYRNFNVLTKDMPDDVVIKTLKWLDIDLKEIYIKKNLFTENDVAKILFQFFWEKYDSDFLVEHPELLVFDKKKGLISSNRASGEEELFQIFPEESEEMKQIKIVLKEFFLHSNFGLHRVFDLLTKKFKKNMSSEIPGIFSGHYRNFGRISLVKELKIGIELNDDIKTAKWIGLVTQPLYLVLNDKVKKILRCEIGDTDRIAEMTYQLNCHLRENKSERLSHIPLYKLLNASTIIEFILYNTLSDEEIAVLFKRVEPYPVNRIIEMNLISINNDWKIDCIDSIKLDEVSFQ